MLTGSTFSETSLWLADDCLCLECSHGLSFVHVCILTESSYKQAAAAAAAKPLQSCPTLCDPIDSSPLDSSVPGILQARTLEWVAISFSNA